jgi:hypothetical protein
MGMSLRTAPSQHTALITALGGSNPDAAIEDALNQVGRGADGPLLLALVDAMVRRGMAGVAARLLESTGNAVSLYPEIATALDEIRASPSGRIPWSRSRERFDRNLDALSRTGDSTLLREIRDTAFDLDQSYAVFETPAGNSTVLDVSQPSGLSILIPFQDERRLAGNLQVQDAVQKHGCLLIGVPQKALIQRMLEVSGVHGFKPPIDLVEPDVPALCCWMHLVDVSDSLKTRQLRIVGGSDALQQYVAVASTNLSRTPPALLLTNHRPGWHPLRIDQSVMAMINTKREAQRTALARRHAMCQEALSPDTRIQRFEAWLRGEAPDLRVMCVTSRYSTVMRYATRDLVQAFNRQGANAVQLMEPDDSSSDVDTWTPLASHACDLVVVINHLRSEYPGRFHPQLPYVCWVQDHMPHIWSAAGAAGLTESDFVISQNPWWLHLLFGYPMDRMLATTNLTDYALSEQPPPSTRELASYACDISYVSHGSATPRQLVTEIAGTNASLHACFMQFLQACERHVHDQGFMTERSFYNELLPIARAHLGKGVTPTICSEQLLPLARRVLDRVYRHESLAWAADWAAERKKTLRIHGRGWEQHPTLKRHAAGVIEHGSDLQTITQASAMTLQVNGFGSMHQRLLDAVMAGGFVLTRYNPVDFISPPYRSLSRYLQENDIQTLAAMHERAVSDPVLRALLEDIEALGMPCNDPVSTARGRATRQWVVDSGMFPASFMEDDAWFTMLRDGHLAAHRAACDLPGFRELTFRSREEMYAMMDRYCADPDLRQRHIDAMRASIIEHDTFDVLARRMVEMVSRTLRNQREC